MHSESYMFVTIFPFGKEITADRCTCDTYADMEILFTNGSGSELRTSVSPRINIVKWISWNRQDARQNVLKGVYYDYFPFRYPGKSGNKLLLYLIMKILKFHSGSISRRKPIILCSHFRRVVRKEDPLLSELQTRRNLHFHKKCMYVFKINGE